MRMSDLFSVYRIGEVIRAIGEKKDVLSSSEKIRRKRHYVLWLKNKKLFFYSGKNASRIIHEQVEIRRAIQVVKGQSASAGTAMGKARIVIPGNIKMLATSMKSFKRGEVLITTMTQPNMVPIMSKSSAVVTDEGGLTSHAAIIARELCVPCVVGTKVATKVFRDGDLVEVNAGKGVVRKVGN